MIVFTQSKTPRQFDFQQKNPIRPNVELYGNLNKKAPEPVYHEFQQFRKMNVQEIPNSKRTLIPEFAVIY
jgi:hypothetical protein